MTAGSSAAAGVAGRPDAGAPRRDRPQPITALAPSPTPARRSIGANQPHAEVLRRPPSRGPRPDPRSHPAGGRRPPAGRPRPSSTSARRPSGSRATCPAPTTSPRATSSSRSRARPRTATRRSILYCAGGVRSLFAAQTLAEMGYTDVASMSGGFQAWKGAGLDFETPVVLTAEQKQRYSRHLLIPEVGSAGQAKLLGSKALLIGAGGLGSPAALYLAAAGVGTIGLVDFDVVDLCNLQRQIIHTTDRVGERKVESARIAINALNPDVKVVAPRGDARRGQRRADHRRLRRDPRRHRHVRDPLHPQRRGGRGRHPGRPRQRLPVRGPAHDLRPVRGPVLPLPVPDPAAARARAGLLRGRRPRRRARASSACSRPTRRSRSCSGSATRSPAGCCCSMPSRPSSPSSSSGATRTARSARDAAVEARKAGRPLATVAASAATRRSC